MRANIPMSQSDLVTAQLVRRLSLVGKPVQTMRGPDVGVLFYLALLGIVVTAVLVVWGKS